MDVQGHELVLHILYHLHSRIVSDSIPNSSSTAVLYENFLLAVVGTLQFVQSYLIFFVIFNFFLRKLGSAVSFQAKSLLEFFPASDKSFSRLLGEVPLLPESALKVLSDLCYSNVIDNHGKITGDIERVTQGLGAIWSLILGRPQYRQACLDIALKVTYDS